MPAYPGCPGKEAVKWMSACLFSALNDHFCLGSERSEFAKNTTTQTEPKNLGFVRELKTENSDRRPSK